MNSSVNGSYSYTVYFKSSFHTNEESNLYFPTKKTVQFHRVPSARLKEGCWYGVQIANRQRDKEHRDSEWGQEVLRANEGRALGAPSRR